MCIRDSYIGYGKQEIKATAGKILKVVMAPDNNVMEEVVVTGYGTCLLYTSRCV